MHHDLRVLKSLEMLRSPADSDFLPKLGEVTLGQSVWQVR